MAKERASLGGDSDNRTFLERALSRKFIVVMSAGAATVALAAYGKLDAHSAFVLTTCVIAYNAANTYQKKNN